MQLHYAVENLRRIKSTPLVKIRPITVLVGRNSAGKSTFLRSLPLIRQSIETKSSAPVLWFGDYVDFGDFETAVADRDEKKEVWFSFCIEELTGRYLGAATNYMANYNRLIRRKIHANNVKVSYVVGSSEKKTHLSKILVNIEDERIDFSISFRSDISDSIEINGETISISSNYEIITNDNILFSSPYFVFRQKDDASYRRVEYSDRLLSRMLFNLLRRSVPGNIGRATISGEANSIIDSDFKKESILGLLDGAGTQAFRNIYRRILSENYTYLDMHILNLQKTARALRVLSVINDVLIEYFHGVNYLGPARAAGERFYRKQELEVSEIAPNGSNFPMFLASLPKYRLLEFSNWVEKIFGFSVELFPSEGHISINLRSGSSSINVTDTGYGMSQVLPVLGVIWWATARQSLPSRLGVEEGTQTLAIEQPELHLHPAHQALLADAFAGAIRSKVSQSDRNINFIVETHSEAFINRLGELIERGDLHHDDVQIVVFSSGDEIDSPANVSLASYNESGALKDWPFGFFNYSQQ